MKFNVNEMQRCALYILFFFFLSLSPQVPVFTFGLSNSGINLSHLVPEEQQSSESDFMNEHGRSLVFKRGQGGTSGEVKNE